MSSYLLLRHPSANRVYAGEAAQLTAAELELTAPFAAEVGSTEVAGVTYLAFEADELDHAQLATVARQSAAFALFRRDGDALRPVELPRVDMLDDDLVTIPKYQGKTNEQFTRLLLNVTLAAANRSTPRRVLDPMAGRGTTISTALIAGCDAFGVEANDKAFEAMAAFYKTYLRRKRIKHTANITPVRREGKRIGRRFDVRITIEKRELLATVFTGDARASGSLYGKKRFDAIVTDAPYGVVHAAASGGQRSRTPARLLAEAIPVWAGQLHPGGALGMSWNTLGLAREELAVLLGGAGLEPRSGGAWDRFAHRVDSSIRRDLIVATKPAHQPG
ncbi:MAG: site-specific DNA-methyltransferase [Propionibacteriaceae bacterium]|nr:site-specific DNA-methyltransferase [Propionibacteriaceae bacterium]